jgi:predicted transcriptional regulator
MTASEQLQEIAEQLKRNERPGKVTVRNLLRWFGSQRRGSFTIYFIEQHLQRAGLVTKPDFRVPWIDGEIEFELAAPVQTILVDGIPKPAVGALERDLAAVLIRDPTYRIGRLRSANVTPISVRPQQQLIEAITIMMMNDFSQLPVMISERTPKGIVSWSSIGKRLALKVKCDLVDDCMDPAIVVQADKSLLAAIDDVVSHQYVLVQAADNKICGIVTTSDLSLQFRQLAEPFLLLGEIENHIRRIIENGNYTIDELKECRDPNDSDREVQRTSDLTFGEYIRLLQKPDRWEKTQIGIHGVSFIKRLEEVRDTK